MHREQFTPPAKLLLMKTCSKKSLDRGRGGEEGGGGKIAGCAKKIARGARRVNEEKETRRDERETNEGWRKGVGKGGNGHGSAE